MSSTLVIVKIIIVYSFPAISLIGLITNLLSLIIFSRKKFKKTIFSTYFRFYLVIEIINQIFPINKMLEFNQGIYFTSISTFCCKIRKFFANYNYAITPSFLVIISIDRFLSIAYPSKFSFRKKSLFQILISWLVIGFNFGLYTPFWSFYLKETVKNQTNQTSVIYSYECYSPFAWLKFINIFQQSAIPLFLMFLFTLLTIRTVFNSRTTSSNNSSIVKTKDIKFAITTITFNILFLFFNLPYFILLLINDYSNFFTNRTDLFKMLEALFYFFFYFNSTVIFFVNYILNSLFRKEFESFVFGMNTSISTSK